MNTKFFRFIRNVGKGMVHIAKDFHEAIDYKSIAFFGGFFFFTWLFGKCIIFLGWANHFSVRDKTDAFSIGMISFGIAVSVLVVIFLIAVLLMLLKKTWDES